MTKQQHQEIIKPQAVGVPSFLTQRAAQDAGKGVSADRDDNIVPLIYVLQAQSPQVNKRSPEYVEGAEAGSLWLRNSSRPIVSGDEGVLFQPCYFSKDWVEWVPRDSGGGFVAKHRNLPEDAERIVDPQNTNKVRYLRPNGNEVIETRNHIGYAILEDGTALPYVIPFTGSGHTVSKSWMFMMNNKRIGNAAAASWYALYRLRTKQRSNMAGIWFVIDPSDAGWVQTEAECQRGAELYEAFARGEKQVESAVSEVSTDTSDNAVM